MSSIPPVPSAVPSAAGATAGATHPSTRRILVVDDNPSIHADFKKILMPSKEGSAELAHLESALFGESHEKAPQRDRFEVEFASQGKEALEKVELALQQGSPFALAFVDMRMPPGWDGLETIQHLWKADRNLQVVICTAYSDRSWAEIQSALGHSDQLLILKKPFDGVEVLQCAYTLTEKWKLGRLSKMRMDALEDQVNARTREVLHANRVKIEFLANMSHELLTPINGLIGLLDAISLGELDSDQKELCGMAQKCGAQLHRLVRDVLDFNDLENHKLKLACDSFDPRDVVEITRSLVAVNAHKKKVEIQTQIDPAVPKQVLGDATRLRQVLGHLCENALKFTEKGFVKISLWTIDEDERCTTLGFEVQDTGRGMSPEMVSCLDHPFTQEDGGMSRDGTGVGMGLSLVHQLLELMQGNLNVQSELGVGSKFLVSVTFPKSADPSSRGSQPGADPALGI